MNLAVIIINEEEKLEPLLHLFKEKQLNNITVLNSVSKVNEYGNKKKNRDIKIFGSLKFLNDYLSDESRLILNIASIEQIETIKDILRQNLKNNQYTFFTIKIDNLEGSIN